MPAIEIRTNVTVADPKGFVKEFSKAMSSIDNNLHYTNACMLL